MNRLRRLWRFILAIVLPSRPIAETPPPPARAPRASPSPELPAPRPRPAAAPAPAPEPEPDVVPMLAMDIPPPPPERRGNRHARRAAERARRRHDKFVEPEGPRPVKHERAAAERDEPKPKPQDDGDVIDDPNDRIIVDEWLKGDGEKVLYEESEIYGEFNFRDTILDQLDRYWVYLERMRKHDQDAYGFYKQVGATLIPYAATHSFSDKPRKAKKVKDLQFYKSEIRLSPWFKQHWPSFGCCAWGTNPRDEAAEKVKGFYFETAKFLYFRRVDKLPWTVQPVRGGKLYVLTIWWDRAEDDDKRKRKWGTPQEFPMHISDDGNRIRVLKTRMSRDGKIRAWWDWRIPGSLENWAREYGLSAQTHLAHIFAVAVSDIELASLTSMLRVEISNGDLTAVFGLSPRRTAYFFQDRDFVLTENGRRRRVFHSVRPFVDKNGKAHPFQFRGMREFTWAGYKVRISVPGRDHIIPLEIDAPVVWDIGRGLAKGFIRESEFGTILKERFHETKNGV